MLQVKNIRKQYKTGSLVQKALDDVSLNLRDNEFVAVLGPSGSGKTTLLNIIGGLDRYDSGDIIINGISTKKYTDRDWDSYRNHTIGFVFQSYNLIPHQTVLANVELALTISGVGRKERRERAVRALEEVGLGDQLDKKPNQMSGGQMQRVAIARALVNNPDILLADEPTGALDSVTSVQVMELLKEVADDRLVVMVTHNPELAAQYATRTVTLHDGKITSDSDPFYPEEGLTAAPVHKNMGRSSMSLLTAFSLSVNNLFTKKARTLLTAFAGSIGIIGIALILALSNGANAYIQDVQEETLSEYPLQIYDTSFNMTSLLTIGMSATEEHDDGEVGVISMVTEMFAAMGSNDLSGLKAYLESGESGIEEYTTAIEYIYDITPYIYIETDDSYRQVNPDETFSSMGFGSSSSSSSLISSMMSTDVFYEMPSEPALYEEQYELVAGKWPESYDECIVVLTSTGSMSDLMMYAMGLRDGGELDEMVSNFINEEDTESLGDLGTYTYDEILGITFKLVYAADFYEYDSEYDVWTDKSDNEDYMMDLVSDGTDLKIVGIVRPDEDALSAALTTGIAYTSALTEHIAAVASTREIVKAQLADSSINVFTGEEFGSDEESSFDMDSIFSIDEDAIADAFNIDEDALAGMFEDLDLGSLLDTSSISLDSLELDSSLDFSDLSDAFGDMDLSDYIDLDSIDLSGLELDIDLTSIDFSDVDLDVSFDTSSLPELDMEELFGSLEITLNTDGLADVAAQLLTGFVSYAMETELATLQSGITSYLYSDEAVSIIYAHISEIIDSYSGTDGDTDEDDEDSGTFYGIDIDEEELAALAADLAAGYAAYAAENSLADISDIETYFTEYLATEEASALIQSALLEMIDTDSLEEQLEAVMASYMTEVMESVSAAIEESLTAQLTAVMEEAAAQIETAVSAAVASAVSAVMEEVASAIESAMSDVMEEVADQITESIEEVMTEVLEEIAAELEDAITGAMESFADELGDSIGDAFSIDTDAFADAFEFDLDEESLTELLVSMSSSAGSSYDSNLTTLGYVDFDSPSEIDIYPVDFAGKEVVMSIIDDYNDALTAAGREDETVSYTDTVGTLMSSVTTIVDTISYILIAFVAISLVVSSIMIGVITYISVLERRKEIGILRAMGASKGNVSSVFNAETFIIGFIAGALGVGISMLLTIPGNYIIHNVANTPDMSMVLYPKPAALLVALSVTLTLIGGLIPSRKAAKSDPVTALRTD